MIKLGVFDLDGTLLTSEGVLPQTFWEDLSELNEHGVHVAIASARPARFLFDLFEQGANLLIAGEDGNVFFRGKELLEVRFLSQELIEKSMEIIKGRDNLAVILSGIEDIYVSEKDYKNFMEWGLERFMPETPREAEGDEEICKIHLYCKGGIDEAKELIAGDLSGLREYCDLQEAGYGWIGIMENNSNKATAVKFFREYLGLSEDEVAVFGDSSNDVPMFETTKYSFAMKNAPEDIRTKAGFVTEEDNDHNGAIKALKKIAEI